LCVAIVTQVAEAQPLRSEIRNYRPHFGSLLHASSVCCIGAAVLIVDGGRSQARDKERTTMVSARLGHLHADSFKHLRLRHDSLERELLHPEIFWPYLRPCCIKVLVMVDGLDFIEANCPHRC